MTHDPEAFVAIAAAAAPAFSRDGQTLFHLRGSGLPQVWALDLATGDARQLTHHDEKVALLRRSPVDDRLIYGIDRGGDERQQLLLIDPRDASPQPRELTANPAAIHDFGGWSSDGARIAYAANDRDEAHFDVYVQDVASGARQRVFDGSNMISVSGFRSDGATLALLRDRGFGNTSLLLLDVASGEARPFGSPGNLQSVRWASDGRTLLALTDLGGGDFLRLCRLDPETGEVSVVYEAAGRDVEAWAITPDARLLATVENDRGYAVLRVGPIDGERPVVTGLPRGVVTDLTWSPDGSALAFSAAAPTEPPSLWLWRDGAARVAWQPEARPEPAGFVDFELVSWESFDGMRIPRLARVAAHPAARRRLSRGHLGPWRAGQPDAAEFPARHADAARAGLRRAAAECARQFRLRPRLYRERRCRTAPRQCDRSRAWQALARRASRDRRRAHRHHGSVVRRLHGDVGDHRASGTVARRGELLRHRRFRHAARRHRCVATQPPCRGIWRTRTRRRVVRAHLADPSRRSHCARRC